jgi:hypothetical protein
LTRLLAGAIIVTLAGCAPWSAAPRPALQLLDGAERLTVLGDHASAVELYDELLAKYPEDAVAGRARAGRESAVAVLTAREEIARLREQLNARETEVRRLREDLLARERMLTSRDQTLAVREGEVGRLQHELSARQAELAKLTAEADRLRTDLEQLKRIDLKLEQRRR